MKPKRFRYLGVLFEDLQAKANFRDLEEASKHISSDFEMGMSKYSWGFRDYSHDGFYKAAKDSKSDLFRCVSNGKTYIPGTNELFLCE